MISASGGPSSLAGVETIGRVLQARTPILIPDNEKLRRAAVAMILTPQSGEAGLDALLIKRAHHPHDPWSGHMAFPGGRHDPGDPDIETTARRETLEEIGLGLEPSMRVGRLDDLGGGRLAMAGLAVSPFVYYVPELPELVPNLEEVDRILRVPLNFLADSANVRLYKYPPDPMAREFPSFPFEGNAIWGITYRMIRNFMEYLEIEIPSDHVIEGGE